MTVSENCKSFIRTLLTVDPDLRPNASEALEHPWLAQLNDITPLSQSSYSSAAFLQIRSLINTPITMPALRLLFFHNEVVWGKYLIPLLSINDLGRL